MRKLLFTFLCSSQYAVLYSFSGNDGFPSGGVILSGNGLYGMDFGSLTGPTNGGQVFSVYTDGTGFKNLLVFDGRNGGYGGGNLILSGNMLYGMTSGGNYPGLDGNVFCIDTNGNNYRDLLDFNGPNGREPGGDVTLIGNKLYGMTYIGGADSDGNIFSIDTDGAGYRDLLDFNWTNGAGPQASFTLIGGRLYAMTTYGGVYGGGLIFRIDTDGSNYKNLFEFNGANGAEPFGNLTFYSNKFYGMTTGGTGATIYGNIFSIDTDGSNYKDLFDFNGTDGEEPFGTLVYASGVLYGTTQHGGTYGDGGVMFSIDTDGTGFKVLFDFHGKYGYQPGGTLCLSGNTFYGVAEDSGAYYKGVIFAFKDTNGGLGVNEVKSEIEEARIYPNPNNGNFTLEYDLGTGVSGKVALYNTLGQKMGEYSLLNSQGKMNISNPGLSNGVYIWKINTTNKVEQFGKVVIMK